MRRLPYFVIFIFLYLLSCHPAGNTGTSSDDSMLGESDPQLDSPADTAVNDSIIQLTLERSGQSLSTELKKVYQRIEVVIPKLESDSLIGELELPGQNRNVRISTIMMPDGQTEGPFGREIRYATKKNGTYVLTLAPNTMAEGTPVGIVNIHIELK